MCVLVVTVVVAMESNTFVVTVLSIQYSRCHDYVQPTYPEVLLAMAIF